MVTKEQDQRLDILNTFLTTPHRELAKIWPVHKALVDQDPRFYVRLAVWYFDHCDVRDHQDMFVITLTLSEFPGHRDVGLALLRKLPPYQVLRVIDFISGRKTTRRMSTVEKQKTTEAAGKNRRRSLVRRLMQTSSADDTTTSAATSNEWITESFGLFRNVPRSVKTEVKRYLREREADNDWFDATVLHARKSLKRLYALLHIKPGERAQQILFDNDPPRDSRLFALRELSKADSPAAQAQAIVENRIPYRVAATVIQQMTPAVLVALIEQMSPQELINNLSSLKRRGIFDDPDMKAFVEEKLSEAKSANRVSAFKAVKAADVAGVDGEVREQLEKIADQQLKAKGKITRPTALLVDKSASMSVAIELGKRIGSMISTICEADLFVYAFDSLAYPIRPKGDELADWEQAFAGITAGNCTSCGIAVQRLTQKRQYVEQIIMITDEGHNTPPAFLKSLKEYCTEMNADPSICFVRTPGGHNDLEQMCRRDGRQVDVFEFAGDYYSLPNLIPLITRPSKLELLMEILEIELPQRQAA